MNSKTKELDKFTEDFFKNMRLTYTTTDLNIIGNKVELPINEGVVKMSLLFANMYVTRFHREINRDALIEAINRMAKIPDIKDSTLEFRYKSEYNKALKDILEILEKIK